MDTVPMLFLVVVFVAVFSLAMMVSLQVAPNVLRGRLERETGYAARAPAAATTASPWVQTIARLSKPLSKLSLPAQGWEDSSLRRRFMNAGYRKSGAPVFFFAAKTLLTFAFPGLLLLLLPGAAPGVLAGGKLLLPALIFLAALGYFLPNFVLSRLIANRQREIFESFPDAIDLMTVCVEAGLGLDAAFARVGDEVELHSKTLAEELHLVTLELRAGSSRERALRNLALRTGVDEIDTLAAMLIQADRFGTSIADSLRIHSEGLRTKRRQRAEEAGAKIPTKLLFPLIFCIFPSMMLVLMGPAFINIYRVLLPTMAGQ
jgi:tight adherence protein C